MYINYTPNALKVKTNLQKHATNVKNVKKLIGAEKSNPYILSLFIIIIIRESNRILFKI